VAFTFDGPNKLIILSLGTTSITMVDCYSRWKEFVLTGDNSKYLEAFSVIGGDPLPGGNFLGNTFFLENGWKIRPQEANHALTVTGNLFDRAGGSPFVNTVGAYNVRIEQKTSNIVDLIATGGSTIDPDDVADAVVNKADTIWPGWNVKRTLRHTFAGIAGKTTGLDENEDNQTFLGPDDSVVFSGTMDVFGNRTSTTYGG